MKDHYYILNEQGEPVIENDSAKWAAWRATNKFKLAQTTIETKHAPVMVSTVFLSSDHQFRGNGPPILWETLVFDGPLDGEMQRYTSAEDAKRGHLRMVERILLGPDVTPAY